MILSLGGSASSAAIKIASGNRASASEACLVRVERAPRLLDLYFDPDLYLGCPISRFLCEKWGFRIAA